MILLMMTDCNVMTADVSQGVLRMCRRRDFGLKGHS